VISGWGLTFAYFNVMTLVTTAAEYFFYMSLGCSMPNILAFGQLVLQKKIFLKNSPFLPLSGGRAICDPRDFI